MSLAWSGRKAFCGGVACAFAGWMAAAAWAQTPAPVTRAQLERVANFAVEGKVEKLATDRARVSVKLDASAARTVTLIDGAGKAVPARMTNGRLEAEIDPRRGYVLAPPSPARRVIEAGGLEFPARYLTVSPQGAAVLGGLFMRASRLPPAWSDAARGYVTELLVGYEFVDGAERALPAPKTVTFFAEGTGARIEADTVVVKASGAAGYQRVVLTTAQLDGETHFTARAGPHDELKSSVAVRREAGALKVALASRAVAAFGIGTTEVVVSLQARDGKPLAATAPVELQVSSQLLRHPSTVTIPAGKESAMFEVRSAGIGYDEVIVRGLGVEGAQSVRLVFPVAALVAAVVGGTLGGGTRFLRNKGKGRSRALLVRRIGEGALVGVILVGAAWAGLVAIDLSAGVLGTPFGAFVLAALGGYVGCVVLDRVAERAFGGLKRSA